MQRTLPLDCSLLPRSASFSFCTVSHMLTTAVATSFDLFLSYYSHLPNQLYDWKPLARCIPTVFCPCGRIQFRWRTACRTLQ